jgi:serine-aspartate repeat-containing protein C/D/E
VRDGPRHKQTVYKDLNRNGQRDTDEPAFNGARVELTLRGSDGLGAAVTGSAAIDDLGRYRFNNVMPGVYSVAASTPAGWNATADRDGPSNGNAFIGSVVLTSGQTTGGNDFGVAKPVPPPVPTPGGTSPPVANPLPFDGFGLAGRMASMPALLGLISV